MTRRAQTGGSGRAGPLGGVGAGRVYLNEHPRTLPPAMVALAHLMACRRCGVTMERGTQCWRCGAWCR